MVFVIFPGPGGEQKVVSLAFSPGSKLRYYLRRPELRRYGMIGRFTRSRVVTQDRKVLRLGDVIPDGCSVHFMS